MWVGVGCISHLGGNGVGGGKPPGHGMVGWGKPLQCGDLYIGETSRLLTKRFWEHLQDIVHKRPQKEIAIHFNNNGHIYDR